ncbi:MAG: DNA-directed RNA polymerase subunit P [Candidatus Aenigmarchaeota archaeon]|nr:DNA-directed RNA polymerase subunit P [Candidatus Aenigmarchaeota archaeon]MCK5176707.1 DNA-directed RNA polymerase subunit P [Candidatus Aenigmarchaeota archaeon]
MAEGKYICSVCRKEVKELNFGSVISCPYCSSKIFFKQPKKGKREIECI